MNQLGAIERRRRNLRILLFAIILGTLPLYCLGFLLWGTAPQRIVRTITPQPITAQPTFEPSATDVQFATLTPFPTVNIVVPPTSQPFQPPVIIPPIGAAVLPDRHLLQLPDGDQRADADAVPDDHTAAHQYAAADSIGYTDPAAVGHADPGLHRHGDADVYRDRDADRNRHSL